MNCEEIQKQLSEYIDSVLEGDRAETMGRHLAVCPRCNEEYADLAECRRLIAELTELDPPIGFAARIMARVNEENRQPPLWERLLYPLRVKVPLQAFAVLLIAVFSVYIYQRNDSETRPPSLPQHEEQRQPQGQPLPLGPFPNSPSPEQSANTAAKAAPAPKTSVDRGAASKAPGPRMDTGRSTPIPAQGVGSSQEGMIFPGDLGARGAAIESLRSSGMRSMQMPGERLFSMPAEPLADYELVLRRQAPSTAEPSAPDVEKTRGQGVVPTTSGYGREQTETSTPDSRISSVEVLWFKVPYGRYEQFKKDLAGQGTIVTETPVAIKEKEASFVVDRPLVVKVTVLPTAEK